MTHMRYWAMSLATAVCGAFIAIERFAFAPGHAVWIAFGVAIAATVFSLGAFLFALLRANQAFSAMSALAALTAGWTIIAQRTFATASALWLAFAGGVVLLLLALRGLALHETTVERVVYALGAGASEERPQAAPAEAPERPARPSISAAMRSWLYWLTHTGLALAGAFVVLVSFAMTVAGHHHASARWITFGIGIAATCLALAALLERASAREFAGPREGVGGRLAAIALTGASAAIAVAMIVTMAAFSGGAARWIAFALGCGLAGASLLTLTVHELTAERVRHELDLAAPARAPEAAGAPAGGPTPGAA